MLDRAHSFYLISNRQLSFAKVESRQVIMPTSILVALNIDISVQDRVAPFASHSVGVVPCKLEKTRLFPVRGKTED